MSTDRRFFPRVSFAGRAVPVALELPTGELLLGELADLSLGGLCVLLPDLMNGPVPGETIRAAFDLPELRACDHIPCAVAHCRTVADGLAVGLLFLGTAADEPWRRTLRQLLAGRHAGRAAAFRHEMADYLRTPAR